MLEQPACRQQTQQKTVLFRTTHSKRGRRTTNCSLNLLYHNLHSIPHSTENRFLFISTCTRTLLLRALPYRHIGLSTRVSVLLARTERADGQNKSFNIHKPTDRLTAARTRTGSGSKYSSAVDIFPALVFSNRHSKYQQINNENI